MGGGFWDEFRPDHPKSEQKVIRVQIALMHVLDDEDIVACLDPDVAAVVFGVVSDGVETADRLP